MNLGKALAAYFNKENADPDKIGVCVSPLRRAFETAANALFGWPIWEKVFRNADGTMKKVDNNENTPDDIDAAVAHVLTRGRRKRRKNKAQTVVLSYMVDVAPTRIFNPFITPPPSRGD